MLFRSYDATRAVALAEAFGSLGLVAAWVVHGQGGLDEVSPSGTTYVAQLEDGRVSCFEVEPSDFGLCRVPLEALRGESASHNAQIIQGVLSGVKGPARTAVVINAAAALYVIKLARTLREAAEMCAEAIDNGSAEKTLDRWAAYTRNA